jgi:hypothetical protein
VDKDLINQAAREHRIFLTEDKDFGCISFQLEVPRKKGRGGGCTSPTPPFFSGGSTHLKHTLKILGGLFLSADSTGVILIRFPGNAREELPALVVKFVAQQGEVLYKSFVVVQPKQIRIRSSSQ